MTTDSPTAEPIELDYRPPRRLLSWLAVLLAVAGWWLSLDLARLSFGMPANTPWLQASCGSSDEEGGISDCQSVLNSRWSSMPLSTQPGATRIPISIFGMGYFAFVGIWYLFVGPVTRSRWAQHLLISAIIFIGVLYSLWMIHLMGNVLHRWCGGCLATHAVNGGLLLVTILSFPWWSDRPKLAPHPRGRLALATLAACAFLFLLHTSIALFLIANKATVRAVHAYKTVVDDPEYIIWDYNRQPVVNEFQELADVDVGEADAASTLVIFSDFRCSACRMAHKIVEDLMEKHPGLLRIRYYHIPQDGECNEDYKATAHAGACRAARAAEAVRDAGGPAAYLKMRKLLYKRTNELENAVYEDWMAELDTDLKAFSEALQSETVAERVQADIELGRRHDIKALPALYLNGRRLNHWSKPSTWETILDLTGSSEDGGSEE